MTGSGIGLVHWAIDACASVLAVSGSCGNYNFALALGAELELCGFMALLPSADAIDRIDHML